MSSALVVTLPDLAPSTNKLYARNRDGSLRLSDDAKGWIGYVATKTQEAANLTGWALAPRTPWTLHLVMRVPAWTRDVDNMLKTTIDGIKQAIQVDDRYLVRLLVERESGSPQTQIIVEIAE